MTTPRYYKFEKLNNSVLALPIHAEPRKVARAFVWVRGSRLYGMIAAKPNSPGAIECPTKPGDWFILFAGHVRGNEIKWAVRCRLWPKWADVEPTGKEDGYISREATVTHLLEDTVVKMTGFPEVTPAPTSPVPVATILTAEAA